ncbi:methyltransferase [Halomonas korlensis]|uniref:Methyltransferase domain-containing protein n=1 Tax=Halomonas korlensis TaxID=463301 RepID=A0A1I7INM1_9GAMM|nr:methyltransferase [Halomonas korlensis]SFU74466.1 Methyltransferase domain-containing protein [Halomonas korlensis]
MILDTPTRFARLTALLAEWQALWRPLPFMHRGLPWPAPFHSLERRLLALEDAECERLQAAPFIDSPLSDWLPVMLLAELVALDEMPGDKQGLPASWAAHIGGRKWQQIEAFVPRVTLRPEQHLVEWCAGKGHLARTLARRHEMNVTALEWQAGLCDAGTRLAERQGAAVRLVHQDVMAAGAGEWLSSTTHVAALHACGDLHRRLIELSAEHGSALTLAPCCYHRTVAERYRPLSRRGRQLAETHGLVLEREDLAMAVQETVTAPRHVRQHREAANAWRLGFDALQRDVRDIDTYLPVPSLAYGQLPETFAGFCHWAACQKGLVLPTSVDWRVYEQAGRRRQAQVARLELVRQLFRRPLEIWLVLDRALRLEEAGFTVELGTFCPRELTPRNLLLRASRA